MKKIMILGIGPLSIESTRKFHGGGNRAWHIAKPLLDAGYEVSLICMRITDQTQQEQPDEVCQNRGKLIYYSVDEKKCFAQDQYLRGKIGEHKPDAIIGACDYPAARACLTAGDLPVWADIHGYPMGEAQAKAFHYQEGGYLHHFWNIHRLALLRADRFSVTSERQRMALIGELGAMGRLNQYTFGEELATTIPIAWDPETPFAIRTREKEDPFIVFFSGGYNLWCDEKMLFTALESAMEKDERIRFLSTGGAIEGHDDKTYPCFVDRVERSKYRDRFDLRGWVSREELIECMGRAHLGINVDRNCYETRIGARNRLIEFMARGIPVLTTLGTEISQILFYKGLALTAPVQNAAALANEIILSANHPEKLNHMAEHARKFFEAQYTYEATVKEMKEWCGNPCHSGDFGRPTVLDYRNPFAPESSKGNLFESIRNKIRR
ncbi:MAG: glycosyltransferase family 4 protein [Candidatus Omnitrophica bacterium]|nr:glycosyltransferase family 4 protein [Candidatus Omnitrophota bacterium]